MCMWISLMCVQDMPLPWQGLAAIGPTGHQDGQDFAVAKGFIRLWGKVSVVLSPRPTSSWSFIACLVRKAWQLSVCCSLPQPIWIGCGYGPLLVVAILRCQSLQTVWSMYGGDYVAIQGRPCLQIAQWARSEPQEGSPGGASYQEHSINLLSLPLSNCSKFYFWATCCEDSSSSTCCEF